MNPEELKARTKKFALRVLNLADKLPRGLKGRVLSDQIARAGTSAAANYRAAGKARSRAKFIAKIGVAEEEGGGKQLAIGNWRLAIHYAGGLCSDWKLRVINRAPLSKVKYAHAH